MDENHPDITSATIIWYWYKFYHGDIIKVRKKDGKIIQVLLRVTVMVGLEKRDKRIWWDSKVVKMSEHLHEKY